MKKFDLKKMIAENKATFFSTLNEGTIEEKYNTYTHKIAEKFAEYMSEKEGRDFTVTPNSVDEYSFDLDVDGLRYEGGSYLIKNNDIINVAVPGNPVYAKLNQLEEGELNEEEISEAYVPSNIKEFAKRKGVSSLVNKVAGWAEKVGKGIRGGTAIGKDYSTLILDMTFEGSEIRINTDNDTVTLYDEPVNSFPEFKRVYDEFSMEDEMTNEGYDEFKRADKGSKDVTAKDKGEEDVYGAGVKKGEQIEKKKMKKSELKAKIKEMIVAEIALDIDSMENAPESEVDFLAELESMLNEADEETDAETEVTDDVTSGDEEVTDTVTTSEVDPNVKAVQDALTQAQAAAQQLGDPKLTDQIGNTITFFTRSHVVEKPKGAVAEELNESIFPMLKKILK